MDPGTLIGIIGGGSAVVIAILGTVCSLVLTAAIVGGVVYFIGKRTGQARALNRASQSWPSTSGTVVTSRVEVSGGDRTSVWPHVVYDYEVGGKQYKGDRVKAGDKIARSGTSRAAYDTIDRYPVGASVTVYYDPEDPTASALER